jgi:hypothetical protein
MQTVTPTGSAAWPHPAANDNPLPRLPASKPAFAPDALARIERTARSAMTSAPGANEWRLVFERRSAPFLEPLMGWTGGREPLAQVELAFPTLEAAVAYAERQGLRYMVRHDVGSRRAAERRARRRRLFSDATLGRLGLRRLQEPYGAAMAEADHSPVPPHEPGAQSSAQKVVCDPNLTVEDKRSILMNRAYDEYLLDQHARASGETRPSLLPEIEQALMMLEGGADRKDAVAA